MKHARTTGALLLAALCLSLAGTLQGPLLEKRRSYHLALADPLENTPPLVAFTTVALGGFRGVIADLLWLRVTDLQEQGRFFEVVQLSDWITKLEPRFTAVWAYHAWNMAYNISVLLHRPEDRWRWVNHGIHLLRDQGLQYNPGSAKLYWELGWLFQHKLGADFDTAHLHYKREWASDMTRLLGGARPDYDTLLDAPRSREELLSDPQTARWVRQRQKDGVDVLATSFLDDTNLPEPVRVAGQDAAGTRLTNYLRVRRLTEEYGLPPALLREVDDLYGPRDWRIPETHALYWAWRGLPLAKGNEQVALKRMIYQSLAELFREGKLDFDPTTGTYETGPDWHALEPALHVMERTLAEHPDFATSIQAAYVNLLRGAMAMSEAAGDEARASALRERLHTAYPEGLPPELGHEH